MKYKLIILFLFIATNIVAQTNMDALMMKKNELCTGISYATNQWTNYWETTLKRENLNLGKVTTNSIMPMANYGITNNLNVLAMAAYTTTKATAGQLAGQQGMQDAAITLKYKAYQKTIKKGILKAFVLAEATTPISNYTPDIMPLSIGLKCKTAQLKLMVNYQYLQWFATISNSFIYRGNVKLDRNTYYTTELHYTNQVAMPNVNNVNGRVGYRNAHIIVEVIVNNWNTLGGFDITRNNMPFVSNNMDATTLGLHTKYIAKFLKGLTFDADINTTISGRNVGQTNQIVVGAFYFFNVAKGKIKTT